MSDERRYLKRRTREHVIADLGVNHVERYIFLAGFTAERLRYDYGLDLSMSTYNADGEVKSGRMKFQVKATFHPAISSAGDSIGMRVETAHFKSWLLEWDPVLLVVYDATSDRAFWLDIQEHARLNELDEDIGGLTITLRIPITQTVSQSAVVGWRERLEEIRKRPRRPNSGA